VHHLPYKRDDNNQQLFQQLRTHSNLRGEKALIKSMNRIDNVLSIHGVPRGVAQRAHEWYRNLREDHSTRGAGREGQLAYAVKLAFDDFKSPHTLDSICKMFQLDKHQMMKSAKKGCDTVQTVGVRQADLHPGTIMVQTLSSMKLDGQPGAKLACYTVAEAWEKLDVEIAHNPPTIAAGLLALVLDYKGLCDMKAVAAASQLLTRAR
jgi:hypothetical protein